MLLMVSVVWGLDLAFPPPLPQGAGERSLVITDRHERPLRAFPMAGGRWRLGEDVRRIDPDYVDALIAYEDKRFYRHIGVDGLAVLRATGDAAVHGRVRSGASTITMQTARLLEPRPRTLSAKLLQTLRALQLESRLTKEEILELYLERAPYGGNLEGVRAASWAWFGREPDDLTPDQIALLLALPQSPEARRPDLRTSNAATARDRVLDKIVASGMFSEARGEDAKQEAVSSVRRPFPAAAWHASSYAVQSDHAHGRQTVSTLDRTLQDAVASRLDAYVRAADETGVQAAALVVDVEGRAVRALVGSTGRREGRAGGWLDLTTRQRSPGSTLKPFIYGLAFDDGVAAPGTRINDLPSRFAGYRPENFDRTFRGEVTVAQALQHSLNVPAVQVLDALGSARFLSALAFAGGTPGLPALEGEDPGLAVALGGFGLSAQDLAVLYAALADGGRALPLTFTEDAAKAQAGAVGQSVMSAESAGEILRILAAAPTPAGRVPAALTQDAPEIAFKTGTSYGFRDAWAAGVVGQSVIIVWTGRPDGAPRPGITGRAAALPLLFDIADDAAKALPSTAGAPADWHRGGPQGTALSDGSEQGPLSRFDRGQAGPQILFPPDRAEIWAENSDRGFVLSARGGATLNWYSDGENVPKGPGGDAVWHPGGPGFYQLAVVDDRGRSAEVQVRVRMP